MPRGNVRVSITSDPSGLERGNKRAEKSLERLGTTGAHHLKNLAKAGAAAGAAYLSLSEAKGAISTTEELAKSTLKLHRNLGLSVKTASEFSAVMKSRDIDAKQGAQTFGILSKQIVALDSGTKSATETFKALGLTQKDLAGQSFDKQLGLVSDALSKMPGGAEKTATAMKVFGRGWQTLLPLIGQGSKHMREQLGLADKYGATFGGKTVGEMKKFINSQHEAALAGIGLQVAFGTKVAPVLTTVIDKVTEFVAQMRNGTGAGGRFADKMKDLWEKLKPIVGTLKDIATFLSHQPRLLALAAAAFVTWKLAAAAQATAAKAKLIATFLGMGPKAAAGGVIAGGEFGTAASGAANTKLRAFKWISLGRFIGLGVAAGIVYALQPEIDKLTGGGLSGNDVVTPTKRRIFNLHGKINRGRKGTQFPHLHQHGATGGLIGGPHGAGDIVPLWTKPGEVLLNEDQQAMVGPGRIIAALKATGGRMLGRFAGAQSGGVVGDFNRALARTNAGPKASLALFEAGIVESGLRNLPYGDADSRGALQIRDSTARGIGVNNMDPYASALAFLTRGFWGHGGAISLARGGSSAGRVAQLVQGSAFPSRYDAVRSQALAYLGGTRRRTSGGGGGGFALTKEGSIGQTSANAPATGVGAHVQQGGTSANIPGTGGFTNGVLNAGGVSFTADQAPPSTALSDVEGAISDVGLHVHAGDESADQGNKDIISILQQAIGSGQYNGQALTPHEILELRAELGDLTSAVTDNTAALLAIKTQQQENTQKLLDVSQRQYPQIFAALMDALSGGIGGRVGLGFQTPGYASGMASY